MISNIVAHHGVSSTSRQNVAILSITLRLTVAVCRIVFFYTV